MQNSVWLGLKFDDNVNLKEMTMDSLPKNSRLLKSTPIFPRRDMDEEVAFILLRWGSQTRRRVGPLWKLLKEANAGI